MKISVSSYSFAQYTRAGKMTMQDCVRKAKEMGFDAIEFIDLPGATLEEQNALAAELKALADELGIEIVAYTVSANLAQPNAAALDAEVQRLRGKLDTAKILGAKLLRHDYCWQLTKTGTQRSFDMMLPEIAHAARRIAEYGASLGIRTCSENHGRIAQDPDRMERLFNAVAHDNYGLLIDIGNFTGVGADHCSAVGLLAPYAIHVHCKDLHIENDPYDGYKAMSRNGKFYHAVPLGEGTVPLKRCLQILKAAGYDGMITVEYEAAEDCIVGIEKGYNFLKKTLAEIDWQ